MPVEEFKSCARNTLGDVVDSWDEVVIQPLIELGRWFRSQDSTVQWLFGGIAGAAGASAVAWIAKIVGVAAAEVVLPIVAAFAVGVGLGTALIVIAECGDEAF
jgi:hypothetical protein